MRTAPAAPTAGSLRRFRQTFKRALLAAYRDNALGIAKGAAYSGLLAFFPVMTSIATILFQVRAEAVARTLSRVLAQIVPPNSAPLVIYQFAARGERPVSLIVVATLLSIWAASGLTTSLMDGFQIAYKIPRQRSLLRHRLVAVGLVFAVVLPAVGASMAMLFGTRTERMLLGWMGLNFVGETLRGWVVIVGKTIRYVIAVGAIILVTGLLYHFGPDRPRRWRDVWPGAWLATTLWCLATMGFGWYVRNMAHYSVMYGSIGAAIALLVWMYVLAIIALVGCEFNVERERARVLG